MRLETWGVLPKPSHRNHMANFRYASRIPGISSSQNFGKQQDHRKPVMVKTHMENWFTNGIHLKECSLLPPGTGCGPDAVKRLSLDNRSYNRLKETPDGRGDMLEGPRCIGKLDHGPELFGDGALLGVAVQLRGRNVKKRRIHDLAGARNDHAPKSNIDLQGDPYFTEIQASYSATKKKMTQRDLFDLSDRMG